MANRPTVQADVDNATFMAWIGLAEVPPIRIGDLMYDTYTTGSNINYSDISENGTFIFSVTSAASGNNITDTDLVVSAAIDAATLPEGVLKIYRGVTGWYDYYHYSSWTGSTFTLDITDHPTGLVRTYGGSEVVYVSKLRIGFTLWVDCVAVNMDTVEFNNLSLRNKDGANTRVYKYLTTFEKPMTVRPLGGKMILHDDFALESFEHVFIDGDNQINKGLRNPDGVFLKDSFGIILDNYQYKATNPLVIEHSENMQTAPTKPSVRIRGIDVYGGFACFRIWQGAGPYKAIYNTEVNGPFVVDETITFSGGGTGIITNVLDLGTNGELKFDTLTGNLPLEGETITSSGTATAICDEDAYDIDAVLAQLISVTNNYMHDGDSEGTYVGHTGDSEKFNPRCESVIVENNVFARRGTESSQMQSFLNNGVEHAIRNNMIVGGAADWISPFQAYQSGTHQYVFGDGNVIIENNIVDMYIDNMYGIFGTSNGSAIGDIIIRRNLNMNGWNANFYHGSTSTLSDQVRFLIEQQWHLKGDQRKTRRKNFTPITFDNLWSGIPAPLKQLFKHIEREDDFPVSVWSSILPDDQDLPTTHKRDVEDTRVRPSYDNAGVNYDNDGGSAGGYDYLGQWGERIWPILTAGSSIDSPTNPGTVRFTMTGPHELSTGDTAIITSSSIYANGTYIGAVTRIDSGIMEITGLAYIPQQTFACTGGGTSTSLQDTVNDFTTFGLEVNDIVRNATDGSEAQIVSISASTIVTTALTGGSDDTWTSGDFYEFVEQYKMYIGSPMDYIAGELVSYSNWPGGVYNTNPGVTFWKCILNHRAAAMGETPPTEPTRWEAIFWDAAGVRSDKVGYSGTPATNFKGFFPPDKVLIPANDYWNKKGVGLLVNPTPTDASYYKWYVADDVIGTNRVFIPGAKTEDFDLNNDRWDWLRRLTNKYLVGSKTPVATNASKGVETFAAGLSIAGYWMEKIIAIQDYGYTAIPTTTEPNPLTTDQAWLTDAVFGDDIRGIKGVGQSLPTTVNYRQQHSDFSSFAGVAQDVWYMAGGIETPEWVDRPDDSPMLIIHNGRAMRFGQNISPTPNEPLDMIMSFRYMPCVNQEVIAYNLRNRGSYMDDPNVNKSGDATTSLANVLEDNVYRIYVDVSQNWKMWKNKVLVGTGTAADISAAFAYFGSNGHPADYHWRWTAYKKSEYTLDELNTIYEAAQMIAPWGKPKWPHIDEVYSNDSQQWDGTGKLWDIWRNKTPTFRGGNGIEGTHTYQWYYFDTDDGTTFPSGNWLDEHLPFLGADGQNQTLERGHYISGNGRGNATIFNTPGTVGVHVMCVVTVKDSNGLTGISVMSQWNQDNIA